MSLSSISHAQATCKETEQIWGSSRFVRPMSRLTSALIEVVKDKLPGRQTSTDKILRAASARYMEITREKERPNILLIEEAERMYQVLEKDPEWSEFFLQMAKRNIHGSTIDASLGELIEMSIKERKTFQNRVRTCFDAATPNKLISECSGWSDMNIIDLFLVIKDIDLPYELRTGLYAELYREIKKQRIKKTMWYAFKNTAQLSIDHFIKAPIYVHQQDYQVAISSYASLLQSKPQTAVIANAYSNLFAMRDSVLASGKALMIAQEYEPFFEILRQTRTEDLQGSVPAVADVYERLSAALASCRIQFEAA